MKSFDEVIEMIQSKDYDNAEKEIDILINSLNGKDLIRAYFIKAYINDHFRNEKYSKTIAKQYYEHVIDSDYPRDYAYYRLAMLEKDKYIAINILKKAIKLFPENIECHRQLLIICDAEEKESIYNNICENNLFDWEIQEFMFSLYFESANYEKAIDIYSRNNFSKMNRDEYKYGWELAYAFALILTDNINYSNEAKTVLEKLIENDIKNILGFKHFLGLSYWYISRGNVKEGIKIFDKIPPGYVIENYEPYFGEFFPLSFTNVFKNIFSQITYNIKSNPCLLAKAKGLRALFLSTARESENNIKIGMPIVKDIENTIKHYPEERIYYKLICDILIEKHKYLEAFRYHLKFLGTFYTIDIFDEVDISYLSECNDDTFKDILFSFETELEKNNYFLHNICDTFLPGIVNRLWENKEYKQIADISSLFHISEVEKVNNIFKIAYSYAEINQNKPAKYLYELLVNNNKAWGAVYNNLSLIYEDENNLNKSYELLVKALECDKNSEIYQRNLKIIKKKLNEEIKQKSIYDKAFIDFQNESIFIKQKIMDFSERMNENNHIICSYKQLPMFLKLNENQAKSILDSFLEKNYVFKVTSHSYDTRSNIYSINPKILNYITELKDTAKIDLELLELSQKLSSDKLSYIGYNDELLACLNKIKTPELIEMLKRDLKENALACLLGQNKAAIILSGSILESILLDKIKSLNIDKAQVESGKTKKIIDMDLYELLFIAKQNNIIKLEIYHFSNAVRIYRNLVHPGVEIKKFSNAVSAENAELMWDILKRILYDI